MQTRCLVEMTFDKRQARHWQIGDFGAGGMWRTCGGQREGPVLLPCSSTRPQCRKSHEAARWARDGEGGFGCVEVRLRVIGAADLAPRGVSRESALEV